MSTAGGHLQRVKRIFESSGITNDVEIARGVAFLLLIRDKWPLLRDKAGVKVATELEQLHADMLSQYPSLPHIPRPPQTIRFGADSLNEVLDHLSEAINVSPFRADLGVFFQREVRFELLKETSGNQYPTPHHIADLMARLAIEEVDTSLHLLDPTAGSGGLLAAAVQAFGPYFKIESCDFDLSWTELGTANLLLHGLTDASMRLRSALGFAKEFKEKFDAVLMNPPFSGSRSAEEVANSIGSVFGRSNPVVLGALAVHATKPGGHAVFLTPTGVLFGSGGNVQLRALLLEHELQAVISLPKDAFQPHSQVGGHVIVVRKRAKGEAQPTAPAWFCHITQDGYPAGAGRDLTLEPDKEINEFPRVRELVRKARQETWDANIPLAADDDGEMLQLAAFRPEVGLPGMAARIKGKAKDVELTATYLRSGALVKTLDGEGQVRAWALVPWEEAAITLGQRQTADEFNWPDLLPGEWLDGFEKEWENTEEGIALEILNEESPGSLKLSKGQTNYRFEDEDGEGMMACLLDPDGEPATPWLASADPLPDDWNKKFGAIAIYDAHEQPCGWLMSFTNKADEGEEVQEATLLVVREGKVPLYRPESQAADTAYALTEQGWVRFAASKALVELGEKVRFRDQTPHLGFALGPSPRGIETAYSLFGLLLPRAVFTSTKDGSLIPGDFQPTTYLPESPRPPVGHPADIVADIRKNQARFAERIDHLLNMLSAPTIVASEPVSPIENEFIQQFDESQKRLWRLIEGLRNADGKPKHFAIADLIVAMKGSDEDLSEGAIRQQLHLFVAMGLIVPVHINDRNVYRMAMHTDLLTEPEP